MDQVALVILLATAAMEPKAREEQALQAAVASQYRLAELTDELARKHTTEEQRRYVGNAALITRVLVERKVVYEWHF